MKDFMIEELFPDRQSILMEQLFSSHDHNSFELPEGFDRNDQLWETS